jgi:large subunit ribosomal protein L29
VPDFDNVAIREMTDDEIDEEIDRAQEELYRLKFRAAYEDLENPALLRMLRRQVARLITIRHERRLVAEEETRDG